MSTRPDRLPIPRQYVPVAIGAGLIILAMVALVTLQLVSQPRALQITPQPRVETRATDASSLSGLPVTSQGPSSTSVPIHVIDAYAAPGGVVLGPFDPAAEPFTFVGRYGDDWAQIQRADNTRIWLRCSDLTLDQLDLDTLAAQPDLTPPTPAARPQYAPSQEWAPPIAAEQDAPTPEMGSKADTGRAERHATAVARLQLPPPAR